MDKQMQKEIRGMDDETLEMEFAFAEKAVTENDPDSIEWLGSLAAERIDRRKTGW